MKPPRSWAPPRAIYLPATCSSRTPAASGTRPHFEAMHFMEVVPSGIGDG